MTSEETSAERWPKPGPVDVGELTDGEYIDSAEVARRLGISAARLDGLVHERVTGGRKAKGKDGELNYPPSPLAQLLPQPTGVLRARVWRAEDIDAVADDFKSRQTRPGPRGKSDQPDAE